jgi:hypothetical protein
MIVLLTGSPFGWSKQLPVLFSYNSLIPILALARPDKFFVNTTDF